MSSSHPTNTARPKPLVLIVLDGVGIAPTSPGNAVTKASTPFLSKAWDAYPHTHLQASEQHVGLPPGIKGNSEVGHTNLGAGRVIYQPLPRINRAIKTGAFFRNHTLEQAVQHTKQHKSKLHIALCFSDSGTHATTNHLEAILQFVTQQELKQPIIIHAFTDGRDSPPRSAEKYFAKIQASIEAQGLNNTSFGTIIGRYYAMDRNESWDRTEIAYAALTDNSHAEKAKTWQEVLKTSYKRNETDEFVKPFTLGNSTIADNDTVLFLNYRADRAIQLTAALIMPDFDKFKRKRIPQNLYFAGMSEYAKGIPQNIIFPKENVKLPFGRMIAEQGLRQLRIAESEKFPHVTYFFNGGRAIKFDGEDRVEVPSPAIATYDKKPEMSIFEVTEIVLEKLSLRIYDFILVNFANGDMVGHTGVIEASIKAMQAVDKCTEVITKATKSLGGATIITADHGNVEEMLNLTTNTMDTEHSLNPVPFIYIPSKHSQTSTRYQNILPTGSIADTSATMLQILGISKPAEMTGKSLLR